MVTSLWSQDAVKENNKKVLISQFRPHGSQSDNGVSEKIQNKLINGFSGIGYDTHKSNATNFSEGMSDAKNASAGYFVDGYYKRSAKNNNLNIYVQVYNPETGNLIDAYNVTDYDTQVEGVQLELDKEELKESDEERINKLNQKLENLLRSNPNKKENWTNIDEYAILSGLDSKYHFPINRKDKSVEAESSAVFDLLQNQITVSSTKQAKQANEAPNLVSVVSNQEMIDYGRISINDILYQLPGFAPSMDYDRRTVSSRGMFEGWNNNHLLLLIDGVQFNDSLYGTAYTWEITPLFMVKSLEVIRGPGSALYGSNATNGVVSLNTFYGGDLKGEIKTRARVGDYGTRIYDILTGNTGKILSYTVGYNSYQTNGNNYSDYDGSGRLDTFGYYQKFPLYDDRKNSYGFLRLDGEGSLKGLNIQYHHQHWNFKTGHGWLWRIPDFKEAMSEEMRTMLVKYTNNITSKLSQEYVLRYQEHEEDWNMRFAENGAYDGYYPAGVSEYLNTMGRELLGRAQYTYSFGNGGSFLAGLEGSGFRHTGDKEHYSNAYLSDSVNGFPPTTDSMPVKLGSEFEWIKSKAVLKRAAFAQLVSGKLFYKKLELTLGIRYDEMNANYKGIDQPYSSFLDFPYIPDEKKSFKKTNPRAGLVYFVTNKLTLKALAGTAFRAPAITELFGSNTWTLASNPRQLKPEYIRTQEFAADWFINRYINFRANVFNTRFENQIAYSVQNNNLSTNIYTLQTQGAELELLFSYKRFSGFLNYSNNKRVDETILDKTVSQSKRAVTWAPTNTANVGVRLSFWKLLWSLTVQRQSNVYRRNSDLGEIEPYTGYLLSDPNKYPVYRPRTVAAWINTNTRLMYNITDKIQFGFFVSNLFNSHQTLIKNNNYPFDYIREGRRFMFDLTATF
ncbi:MAG: TonB-dependent receptor [Leptospiraceae bacterium]|nr:TonB-dependent receptor [Leptospiraceae bacterium]